jgi:hypothetical protein
MFILFATRGEYEDKEEWAIAASKDESKLLQHAEELKAARAKEEDFQTRLHQLYIDTINANPKPVPTRQRYERPRWAPGLGKEQITQEMREERKAWEENERLLNEEYITINIEWQHNVWFPVYRAFLATEGREVPETIDMHTSTGHSYFEEIRYHTEEVPELV